jgi:hypothetical protein
VFRHFSPGTTLPPPLENLLLITKGFVDYLGIYGSPAIMIMGAENHFYKEN